MSYPIEAGKTTINVKKPSTKRNRSISAKCGRRREAPPLCGRSELGSLESATWTSQASRLATYTGRGSDLSPIRFLFWKLFSKISCIHAVLPATRLRPGELAGELLKNSKAIARSHCRQICRQDLPQKRRPRPDRQSPPVGYGSKRLARGVRGAEPPVLLVSPNNCVLGGGT
jgi:hypothetical protein